MKIWIPRLTMAFTVLVIAGALLGWLNRSYFIGKFLEGKYEQRVSLFTQFLLSAGDVVMVGDSITEGGPWSEMFPGVPIKNRGIGGDTTTGLLARLDDIVGSKPAAVFLKIGTNDLTHGPDERSASYQQYEEIVKTIRTGTPKTRLYLQSLLPREADRREDIEAFNVEIARIAQANGAQYIDLYPAFLAEDGSIEDSITGDELHLNGPGYAVWQAQLLPYLEKYVEKYAAK